MKRTRLIKISIYGGGGAVLLETPPLPVSLLAGEN